MSAKVTGWVWDSDLSRDEKLIMLAYADHADHEGNNIKPSTGLVCWMTGYGETSVRRIKQQLITKGYLIDTGDICPKYKTIIYRIDKNKLPTRPPRTISHSKHGRPSREKTPSKINPLQNKPHLSDGEKPPQHVEGNPKDMNPKNKKKKIAFNGFSFPPEFDSIQVDFQTTYSHLAIKAGMDIVVNLDPGDGWNRYRVTKTTPKMVYILLDPNDEAEKGLHVQKVAMLYKNGSDCYHPIVFSEDDQESPLPEDVKAVYDRMIELVMPSQLLEDGQRANEFRAIRDKAFSFVEKGFVLDDLNHWEAWYTTCKGDKYGKRTLKYMVDNWQTAMNWKNPKDPDKDSGLGQVVQFSTELPQRAELDPGQVAWNEIFDERLKTHPSLGFHFKQAQLLDYQSEDSETEQLSQLKFIVGMPKYNYEMVVNRLMGALEQKLGGEIAIELVNLEAKGEYTP